VISPGDIGDRVVSQPSGRGAATPTTPAVALADRILQDEHTAAQKLSDLMEQAALVGLPQAACAR
jgi:hypothetical protein